MNSPLALFIMALSTAPAKSHNSLSTHVAHIVRSVAKEDIQTTFACLNRSLPTEMRYLTGETMDEINGMIRSLLKGNERALKEVSVSLHAENPQMEQNSAIKAFENKAYRFMTTKTQKLQELAFSIIPAPYKGLAATLAQKCMQAFASTRTEQEAQNTLERMQETALLSYPLLSVAHEIACDKAIELIFTIHCEKARPCDRMAALFIINQCSLFGKKGRVLQAYVARLNRYYFSPSGILRCYDPMLSSHRNKRIKSLIRFLTMICSTHEQYLKHLKKGINMGVPELIDRYFADKARNWRPRNRTIRRFTTSLLQTLVGSQITLWKKVDPAVVRKQPTNKAFMVLIDLCAFSPKMNSGSMCSHMKALINQYRESSPCLTAMLNRYYNEVTPSS